MAPPARLYKYRSASPQDVTNLSSGKIWFAHPTQFNDPFDCALEVPLPELTRGDCIKIISLASHGRVGKHSLEGFSDELLRQQVSGGLKESVETALRAVGGVSCFSTVCDNLLMWSHYAQSHRGFCLEFSPQADSVFQKARRVRYADSFPCLSLEAFCEFDFDQVLSLLLTKATCWSYEEEWRVFHQEANKLYGYERSSLTGIYFGAKMPEDQIAMLAAILENTEAKLYRMKLSPSSFALESEPLTFSHSDFRSIAGR